MGPGVRRGPGGVGDLPVPAQPARHPDPQPGGAAVPARHLPGALRRADQRAFCWSVAACCCMRCAPAS
ncbi:hypothetical protein G6F59_018380 [Rhizopus arrhizus]|nr:hypothetical protein G6F59_018380 [Rhizopus arrhizus]